ncbi:MULTISPECIES: hypothetical protein [unclassified Clostridium]|uniref:hypothetical protein n=1 Tax=unclassified Clostridium TaxID=2614128 RepID=UPI0025BC3B62|nr:MULTISPECIES: hypothetical protein [unclassified Clostridium]
MDINRKYRITSNEYNIILQEKQKVLDKETGENKTIYKNAGYFSDLHWCLKNMIKKEIKSTKMEDLQTIVHKIDELYKLIDGLDNITVDDLRAKEENNDVDLE